PACSSPTRATSPRRRPIRRSSSRSRSCSPTRCVATSTSTPRRRTRSCGWRSTWPRSRRSSSSCPTASRPWSASPAGPSPLARALLERPKVLLLDDATSSLDPTTEARILTALSAQLDGITTVAVANRPATIALADEVIYLVAGRVVAHGRHEDLLATVPGY